jgi:beta-glucosidase
MKELGLKAYRFSIAWPRVIPDGDGKVNEKGLDFYERLIDALGEAGIVPYVTLFHWDYPYDLFRKGGWMNPESPKWFLRYPEAVAKRLGASSPLCLPITSRSVLSGFPAITPSMRRGYITPPGMSCL